MKLDVPSFLLGAALGAGAVALAPRLRPIALEIASSLVKLGDAITVRIARGREGLEDLWAEAKARARHRGPAAAAATVAS